MGRRLCFWIGLLTGLLMMTGMPSAMVVKPVLERPAIMVQAPEKVVLIDVTVAGQRLVAVGERGVITISDDGGESWRQADVPVSTTLTAVFFPTPDKGWAVGHSGVILHTRDAGATWQKQLDGLAAAAMALESAKAVAAQKGPDDSAAAQMLGNAELLVADGADKPFLDLCFKNDQEGIVVGSYGLIFGTRDGGRTWHCLMDRLDNPDGLNLYAIRAAADTLYISGEQGLFFLSEDAGNSFRRIETPYAGTFFDLAPISARDVVIVGLRGNAFWSDDQGRSLHQTKVPVEVSFTAAGQLGDGTLIFANQAGMLLNSLDGGRSIQPMDIPQLPPISAMVPLSDGSLMTVGYGGAIRVQLPDSGANKSGGQP
jgi:photosystem II stability/assembly factor-like uncharacterized protein